MRVIAIWRYPVKSMSGEQLEEVQLNAVGLEDDRRFGILDRRSGNVLSAKREGRLLLGRASMTNGTLVAELPTGARISGPGADADAALSAWLGYPVSLVEADPVTSATYASQSEAEDDLSPTVTWTGPPGSLVDSSPVHLLTTASLRAMAAQRPDLDWNVARFRPNVLLDSDEEDLPAAFALGSAELEMIKACERCVMTTRPQEGLDRELGVLQHLAHERAGEFGVLVRVRTPGSLGRGAVLEPRSAAPAES